MASPTPDFPARRHNSKYLRRGKIEAENRSSKTRSHLAILLAEAQRVLRQQLTNVTVSFCAAHSYSLHSSTRVLA